jgi:hypothetical protein
MVVVWTQNASWETASPDIHIETTGYLLEGRSRRNANSANYQQKLNKSPFTEIHEIRYELNTSE